MHMAMPGMVIPGMPMHGQQAAWSADRLAQQTMQTAQSHHAAASATVKYDRTTGERIYVVPGAKRPCPFDHAQDQAQANAVARQAYEKALAQQREQALAHHRAHLVALQQQVHVHVQAQAIQPQPQPQEYAPSAAVLDEVDAMLA